MNEPETFTAEDYYCVLVLLDTDMNDCIRTRSDLSEVAPYVYLWQDNWPIILSSLRIAANVMRPGVIADAIDAALNRRDIQIDEEAIRKALLG